MPSISILLVLFSVPGIFSAVLYEDQIEISGHEGQCYDEDGKTFYEEGDVMRSGESECAEKNCLGFYSPTGKIRVQTLTCPAVKAGPGFTLVQDSSKPYPHCCPKLVPNSSDLPDSECCAKRKRQK